jgi:multidrug resistance efflux pump
MNNNDNAGPPVGADGTATRSQQNLSERVRSLRLNDTPGKGGGSRGGFLPWALCIFFALAATAFGAKAFLAPPASTDATSPGTSNAVSAGSEDVVLEAKGYVIPAHQIQVSPKVAGMIVWLDPRFQEGWRVEKDTVIAKLETDDYDADLKHSEAVLASAERKLAELETGWPLERAQAQVRLDSARTNMEFKRRDLERMQRSTTGSSPKDIDEAKSTYDQAVKSFDDADAAVKLLDPKGPRLAKIQSAKADVEAAQADVNHARWRFKQTEIIAPVTGTVLTKKAEKGNLVNPVAFNVSASLCEMADLGDLEVDLSIQERDIATVEIGQPTIIMPDAFVNNQAFRKRFPEGFKGHVSRMMPIADRSKGSHSVRVVVDKTVEDDDKQVGPDEESVYPFWSRFLCQWRSNRQIKPEEEGVYLKPEMGVIVSFKKKK